MASKRRRRAPKPGPAREARAARYRVELKTSAARDLAGLERRDLVRVVRKIDTLAVDPPPPGAEKLRGAEDIWRVRVGDYRILYAIRDDVLLVLAVRIGQRREVYR